MRIPWGWVPFFAIGACAVANAVLITTVMRVRPEAVRDQPYLASLHQDAESAARRGFAASGMRLHAEPTAGGLRLRLEPVPVGLTGVSVECYRASDRAADRRLEWADPTQPLEAGLPAAGRWVITLRGHLAAGAVVTTVDGEAGPAAAP